MRTALLYSIILLAVTAFSCTKPGPWPDPKPAPSVFLPQDFKDFTDFKAGSYWIYVDSLNSAIQDSIIITSHHQFMENFPESYGDDSMETFVDTMFSSKDGILTANGNLVDNSYAYYNISDIKWPGVVTTYSYGNMPNWYTPANKYLLFKDSFNTVILLGKQYQNLKVFVTTNINGISDPSIPLSQIYWAKNIGVIQKTVFGKTWILVRYRVMQ